MRKLKHLLLILVMATLIFGQYEIPIENLLTNSGFGVWSQSDAAKGIAALIYDTGSAGGGDIPDVGDAVTGGSSGATGKIMSMTIATGTFAGNNATGVIQLGSTTGCFNDDEAVTFTDLETAIVNHPDGAVGADKIVKNGAFVHDIDPPNDWNASNATLTTEGAGQIGNCLMVANVGDNWGYANQQCTTVIGKIYRYTVWFKKGTGPNGRIQVGIPADIDLYYDSGAINNVAWTEYTGTFEATTATSQFILSNAENTAANTAYFDEVTLYEITPGCTGGDANALDLWIKDTTIDIYREHNGANTKDGSFYALKMVVTAASDFVRWPGAFYNQEEWYMQFQGRTVTKGEWVKTTTANHAKLTITDSAGSTDSPYHTGGGAYEWLEVTRTIDGGATSFAVYIFGDVAGTIDGNTIIYISQPILAFQSSIGTGNYSPRQHEWIYFEKYVTSNKYDNTTTWSDTAYADLNLEADSNAMIPKGAKAIMVHVEALDSGSGALVDVHIHLRINATTSRFFTMCWGGRTNGVTAHLGGMQPCDPDGDIQVEIEASGAGTLDITRFRYSGVQVTD